MNCKELQIGNKKVFSLEKSPFSGGTHVCLCNKVIVNGKKLVFNNNELKQEVESNVIESNGLLTLPNKVITKTFAIENSNNLNELNLTCLIKQKRFTLINSKLVNDDIEYTPINWTYTIQNGIFVDVSYRILVLSETNEIEIMNLEIPCNELNVIEENSVYGIPNTLTSKYSCPVFFLDENDKLIIEDQYRMKTLCTITETEEVFDIVWCKYQGVSKKFATLRNKFFNYDKSLYQTEQANKHLVIDKQQSNYKINFTTNTNDNIDVCIINQVVQKLESIIKTDLTLDVEINIQEMSAGILGSAGPGNSYVNKNGYYLPENGSVTLNKLYWDSEKIQYRNNYNVSAYYTLLHETCHVLGIGSLWVYNNLLMHGPWYEVNTWWYSDFTTALYIGEHAFREYKLIQDRKNPNHGELEGIPIEDDGGVGTKGGHVEEGDSSHSRRYFDGVEHYGLDNELMSGWAENSTITEPLSKITVGFLEDIGYTVNYENADYF